MPNDRLRPEACRTRSGEVGRSGGP